MTSRLPWAAGPGEILRHGINLLENDTDTNRRLAMISIDNAVELMIKTYLGLPNRLSGLSIPRAEYQAMAENFPALLDGLEKYASDRLAGVDLGTIEWYHRLRNELYHQGNGLTVERDKIEIYAELANQLFENLFGERLTPVVSPAIQPVSEFLGHWVTIERGIQSLANAFAAPGNGLSDNLARLANNNLLTMSETFDLINLRDLRNVIVHGDTDSGILLTPELLRMVKQYAVTITERAKKI